jgi:hypothetical protein
MTPEDCSADKYAHCMAEESNWKQDAMGWGKQWMD